MLKMRDPKPPLRGSELPDTQPSNFSARVPMKLLITTLGGLKMPSLVSLISILEPTACLVVPWMPVQA